MDPITLYKNGEMRRIAAIDAPAWESRGWLREPNKAVLSDSTPATVEIATQESKAKKATSEREVQDISTKKTDTSPDNPITVK